ncbi:MAG: rRNA pseudouridine synthase [Treponema sp.]|nr:rRNA pseudouridine synthase [Treponema sp.]
MRGSYLPDNSISNSKEEVRLQVFLAHSGVASRRASEKIILDGRIAVNGVIVTGLGTKVSSKDKITLDGKPVSLEEQKRYVLMYKPLGVVCSQSDEKGRPCAVDLLKEKYSERLYNVGRLDMFSHGALIFTNDGDFAARLSHPSAEIEKEYIVESSLPLPRFLAEDFKHGIRVDGLFYKAKDAEEINSHKMRVVLVEGKNREIRRVFENAGVAIRNLCRVRIGNVELGEMKPGEFRDLSQAEVKGLLNLCKN